MKDYTILRNKLTKESQITTKEHAKDEDFKEWDRVLKKYAKLARDVRNLVE